MPERAVLFHGSELPAFLNLNMLVCDFFFANLFEGHPGSLVHIGILSNFARFKKASCRETHCTSSADLPNRSKVVGWISSISARTVMEKIRLPLVRRASLRWTRPPSLADEG